MIQGPHAAVSAAARELLRKRVQPPAVRHARLEVTQTLMEGKPAMCANKDLTRHLPECRVCPPSLVDTVFQQVSHVRTLEGQTRCISCDADRTTQLLAASRLEDCVCLLALS